MGVTGKEASATPLPGHVAVIMDGNGRWAKSRHLPRIEGHRRGAEAARAVIRAAAKAGVGYLTLYAFSVENWSRPKREVDGLMKLLTLTLRQYEKELTGNNIRLLAIGRLADLPAAVRQQLDKTMQATAKCTGMSLVLALSYGSRVEIVEACRAIAEKAVRGVLKPAAIAEETIRAHLYTGHIPDPDLLVRTSGEMRLSNFLLWQASYAEIHVTPTLWPDFGAKEFQLALDDYGRRQRRFGGV